MTESNEIQYRDLERPETYGLAILSALQGKPLYYGTADPARVAKSRAKNKAARRARRANRRG